MNEKTLVPTVPNRAPIEGLSASDIIMPRLNLVQSVGPLSEHFAPGEWVLNGELSLSDGKTPLTVHIASVRKMFIEKIPYGGDQLPREFATEQEVRDAGGWTTWRDGKAPPFLPELKMVVLIENPDGEAHPLFPFAAGDKSYAAAAWTVRGAAYPRAGRTILTAATLSLRNGVELGQWELKSVREKLGAHFVWLPKVTLERQVEADSPVAALAREVVG